MILYEHNICEGYKIGYSQIELLEKIKSTLEKCASQYQQYNIYVEPAYIRYDNNKVFCSGLWIKIYNKGDKIDFNRLGYFRVDEDGYNYGKFVIEFIGMCITEIDNLDNEELNQRITKIISDIIENK